MIISLRSDVSSMFLSVALTHLHYSFPSMSLWLYCLWAVVKEFFNIFVCVRLSFKKCVMSWRSPSLNLSSRKRAPFCHLRHLIIQSPPRRRMVRMAGWLPNKAACSILRKSLFLPVSFSDLLILSPTTYCVPHTQYI